MKNLFYTLLLVVIFSCGQNTPSVEPEKNVLVNSKVEHVQWAEDAVIYEVNIRQYTPEGTFSAFQEHLPRLKTLGVDILWLMPIHPIGEENRKGSMGSYYSVKDYTAINPEFGTLEDLAGLIEEAHFNGMYVIIDWVANHTAWDNVWITEHPDWYAKDSTGEMYYPADWTDVAQLDYDVPELHDGMIEAMKYWVEEVDIDGFRCDVAGMVPVAFWDKARLALDNIKPVFMLAEDEQSYGLMENAFDMNYSWHMHHIMNEIAKGNDSIRSLKKYFAQYDTIFSKNVIRMNFITNHDENTWSGTVFERFGEGVKPYAVLSFTVPGMPLIYTGQEAGLDKRLAFFEKDSVDWANTEYMKFYQSLIELRKSQEALYSGNAGGDMQTLCVKNKNVFAYKREKGNDGVIVFLNLSAEESVATVPEGLAGAYKEYFSDETELLNAGEKLTMEPWAYKVFVY